jgi:hypothetical protein
VRIKAILDSALPESAECTGPSASLISVALKCSARFLAVIFVTVLVVIL